MSFRDKLLAFIPEDKRKDAESVLDDLDTTLDSQAKDLREIKAELRKSTGIKPEDLTALENENKTLTAQIAETGKALKVAQAAQKAAEDAKTTVEKEFGEKLTSEQAAINRLLVEDGLTKGLTGLGIVKPAMQAAAAALLKQKGVFSVKAEGDIRKAIAKAQKDGKDVELGLDEYLKTWAQSDEGKEFVPASLNQGGGARGGSGQRQQSQDGPKLGKTVMETLALQRQGTL